MGIDEGRAQGGHVNDEEETLRGVLEECEGLQSFEQRRAQEHILMLAAKDCFRVEGLADEGRAALEYLAGNAASPADRLESRLYLAEHIEMATGAAIGHLRDAARNGDGRQRARAVAQWAELVIDGELEGWLEVAEAADLSVRDKAERAAMLDDIRNSCPALPKRECARFLTCLMALATFLTFVAVYLLAATSPEAAWWSWGGFVLVLGGTTYYAAERAFDMAPVWYGHGTFASACATVALLGTVFGQLACLLCPTSLLSAIAACLALSAPVLLMTLVSTALRWRVPALGKG